MPDDGSSQIATFAARCERNYRQTTMGIPIVNSIFIVGLGGVAVPLMLDMSPWNLLGTVPMSLLVVGAIRLYGQVFLEDAERKYLRNLRRHIRSNLFGGGLWLRLLEGETDETKQLFGISLPEPSERSLSSCLNALMMWYPEMCRSSGLTPYPSEYEEAINSSDQRKPWLQPDITNMWQMALGQAVSKELMRNPGKRSKK